MFIRRRLTCPIQLLPLVHHRASHPESLLSCQDTQHWIGGPAIQIFKKPFCESHFSSGALYHIVQVLICRVAVKKLFRKHSFSVTSCNRETVFSKQLTTYSLHGSSPIKGKINFKRLNVRFWWKGKDAPAWEGRWGWLRVKRRLHSE